MGEAQATERKLTIMEQVICALPIALIVVGGAIGGLCGGAAWAVNQKIMRGQHSPLVRYSLVALTFVGAIAGYFVGIIILAMTFPNLFAR